MSRVETIGDATLFLADCRDISPTLHTIDAVVTDPPYGIGFTQRTTGATITGDDAPFDPSHVLALKRPTIMWGAENFANKLPDGRWLIWVKRAIEIIAPKSYGDCEIAWFSEAGTVKAIRHISDGCIREGEEHGIVRVHPSQKPVAVMRWCLGFVPEAETILDPYMGSGTTGVACAKLGRKFIGIEIEPKYFDIACKRIERAYAEPELFIQAAPQPTQEAMF